MDLHGGTKTEGENNVCKRMKSEVGLIAKEKTLRAGVARSGERTVTVREGIKH